MFYLDDRNFNSRLLIGTARYPALDDIVRSIECSGAEIATVSLRRSRVKEQDTSNFLKTLKSTGVNILPNTSGCFSQNEIITVSEMAREIFETNWIKLEAIGDDYTLFPDPVLLIESSKELVKRGFKVFPYTSPDIVVCRKLVEEAGLDILMPLAAPIGTGQGPVYIQDLERLRDRFPETTLIVDAGIGKPSHAAQIMEMGYDALLINTAIAQAVNPAEMALAFSLAITAGRKAHENGMIAPHNNARTSSPLIDQPFWHCENDNKTGITS